jgi:hypothetical protein
MHAERAAGPGHGRSAKHQLIENRFNTTQSNTNQPRKRLYEKIKPHNTIQCQARKRMAHNTTRFGRPWPAGGKGRRSLP